MRELLMKYPGISPSSAWYWFSSCSNSYTKKYFTCMIRKMKSNSISFTSINIHQINHEYKLQRTADEMQSILSECTIDDALMIFKNIKISFPTQSTTIQVFTIKEILIAFQELIKTYNVLRSKIDQNSNQQKQILLSSVSNVSMNENTRKIHLNNQSFLFKIIGKHYSLANRLRNIKYKFNTNDSHLLYGPKSKKRYEIFVCLNKLTYKQKIYLKF